MVVRRGSLVSIDAERAMDLQLRVTPTEVKFLDALSGKVYRLPVTVHNLGPINLKIRFLKPLKPQFKLILTNLDKELASGLQMTATVEYRPNKNEDIFDQLFILLGKKAIKIPLIGLIPTCQLEIESEVNFGTLVSNSKVHCKEISIRNHGKAPGKFTTEYQGQLPIVISPSNGIVKPMSSTIIKVDFCADQPRVVKEVAKVSLQDRPDTFLNIKVRVVEQIIELLSMSGNKKVECIHFGSTFFGTSKLERAVLYNNSPAPINWVAVMQNDAVGEELGTDIHQRTDVAINNLNYLRKIKDIDVTLFISCVPNSGRLLPYQKTTITFCFSPKLIADNKKDNDPSHRQDYAVFLRIDSVGSKDGFLRDDDSKTITSDQFQKLELALTGSGLPLILQFDPGTVLNFAPCSMGEHSDVMFTIYNQSKLPSVMFNFKKIAWFKMDPQSGLVSEGHMQEVKCSFIPNQLGEFKVKQVLEMIGSVANENFQSVSLKPFHEINLIFNCVCRLDVDKVVMKNNCDVLPLINNPTGRFMVKDWAKSKEYAPVAMLQSTMTSIHSHRSRKETRTDALIAFPNDRAASIKSGEQNKHFRTIFTNIPRYNYVDPDFAYTNSEALEKKAHKDRYAEYIKTSRNMQKQTKREDMNLYDETDAELQLASDLKAPSLPDVRLEEDLYSAYCKIKPYQLLSTNKIESKEAEARDRKVLKELKSEPSTLREKHDCSLNLTPKQIHQVIVGPAVLNFGDICVNSTNYKQLHIVNMLPMHILIRLDVNLKELQKTKQFSCVIPPTASTRMSVVFESPTAGKFWKSFTFTVNNIPGGHILVMAEIMPVRLELSSKELVLRPQEFLLNTCFRETVTLHNHQNYFVHFEWQPVSTSRGIGFFIRPAKGTVEPFCSLECEVTWKPSFSSPERGEFILHVDEGNTTTLKCVAHPGHPEVVFLEPKVIFSITPQGITSWKRVRLHNVGQKHAYFKVREDSLLPMINIVPSEGIIPYGGLTVLNISCTPTTLEPFDTRAKISIRCAKAIDFGIGGTVEIADVEISPDTFLFNGTYVGTTQVIPCVVKNKGVTRARVEFNLQGFKGFSMDFEDKLEQFSDPAFPDIYFFELEKKESLTCGISFSPKEVATYEFSFQVRINCSRALERVTHCHLSESAMTPKTTPFIRMCFVQATVVQVPLRLSSTDFIFEIPSYTMTPHNKVTKTEDLVLHNFTSRAVLWILDISKTEKLFKDGTFKLSELSGILQPHTECSVSIYFCPKRLGKYTANIPLRLNDNPFCYQTLHLVGEVKSPMLLFKPPFIFFTPVPLDVTAVMDITILPQSYFSNAVLSVKSPSAGFLDGSDVMVFFSVTFPGGRAIPGSPRGINTELSCRISFKSSKPVSLFTSVIFYDDIGNSFPLPVFAAADNCILTIYPYMALHHDKQDIVLRNDKDGSLVKTGENISFPSQKAGSSSLGPSKYSNAEPAKSLFIGTEIIPDKLNLGKSETSKQEGVRSIVKQEKNEQFFPEEGTKTYDLFQKAVNAAQTWFTLFGWSEGPHSLSIPETIRRDVCKKIISSGSSRKRISRENEFLRYNKTIYDVIHHLTGRKLDGIKSNQSLPENSTERVTQLHMQYTLLLEFLNAQGAHMPHVFPEFLFDLEDYKKWIKITSSANTLPVCSSIPEEKNCLVTNLKMFEACSKRVWTDLFLQIYKVLVLSRVVARPRNNSSPTYMRNSPKVNPHFKSSNIYSNPERVLLSWMNTNYENTRHIIWKNIHKGDTDDMPSERWIVNFDKDLSDGLVLATLLGAYCPFLIETHFVNMYTHPTSSEHSLHNSMIIVTGLREIGFSVGIQASDICDPNPILLLMLCVYMYERLPTFLPRKVITFECTLHDTVMQSILLKNTKWKTLVYNATIIGRDADDFSLSQTGNTVTVYPRDEITVTVKFTSRFLYPAEASLILLSKSAKSTGGTTLTFTLKGKVRNFKAIDTIQCNSPCYKWMELTLMVKNPFHTAGDFNVMLVESSKFISLTSQLIASGQFPNRRKRGDAGSSEEDDVVEGSSDVPNELKTSIKSSFIREFFCKSHTLYLGVEGSSSLELIFLPFDLQTRYCIVLLSNKQIGELIYIVEGNGMAPLPSDFLPVNSSTSRDYSNVPKDVFMEKEPVLFLEGMPYQFLNVDLILPLINEAKEKALAFAAQHQMSEIEYRRRFITGTLESSSIRVAIAILGLTRTETFMLFNTSQLKKPKSISYITELSLPEYFRMPKRISIPQYPEMQANRLKPTKKTDGCFSVPVQFFPVRPGRYPCKILLTSLYDVRLYCIEGVVNEVHPQALLKFEAPAFKVLTQDIPITNTTDNEWQCQALIEGEHFYGPSILYVRPGETVPYPLTFKPVVECEIVGKFILQNEIDGIQCVMDLKGIGKKPLALKDLIINCKVGITEHRTIMVPNYTKNKVTFKVSSNVPIVSGDRHITIDPQSTVPYILCISSRKRGLFRGRISFSIESTQDDDSKKDIDQDNDQNEDEAKDQNQDIIPFYWKSGSELFQKLDEEDSEGDTLHVWYDLEIHIHPGKPIDIIEMKCIAMESICFEIPLCNEKEESVSLEVQLTNPALSGLKEFVLRPKECISYAVCYSPATTGCRDESIVFQPDKALEFWYLLKFTVELPKPTTIPEIKCDLGKYLTQKISLVNTTHETLELEVTNNNPDNFVLDTNQSPLTVLPFSTKEVPVDFHPSGLGRTGHQASIIFHCAQFKEWKFLLSGVGLYPQPQEIEITTTYIHSHSPVIISFQNPTKEEVLINMLLTNQAKPKNFTLGIHCNSFLIETSAFKFNLDHTQGIALPPKGIIKVPVLFLPKVMALRKTMVIVQMMRANGESWPIDNCDELDAEMKRMMGVDTGKIQTIQWIYPIIGLPKARHTKWPQVVVGCQAKKQADKELTVTLAGEFLGDSPILDVSSFLVFPRRNSYASYEDVDVTPVRREFEYEILFESEEVKSNLESCVSLSLKKKSYDPEEKLISLTYKLVFSPKKPLRSQITLKVECITDGIWEFPVTLVATEPDLYDVINIEGAGLFKEATVDFPLISRERYAEHFTASFLPGSDPEFFVRPQSGEFPPCDTDTIYIVVGFKPRIVNRKYKATLVIQTKETYDLYAVNGLPQVIEPPKNVKAKIDATYKTSNSKPLLQRNFILENAKHIEAKTSSTIKGFPSLKK
ncbi:cilia- and flagella-associated protein 47 [Rhinolophus ferrumequinum]|uniref:cilia- and flagella-associated protein 47 n=1 Tax=Rhinolophus ferrumequinum TaxID=59479 RepID=UPI00140F7E75|nr:cilia- and flagella-associated protein 47 [Rhinolophus ferrumequinum]